METVNSKSDMPRDEATNYLNSLLCRNLRVTTTDSRMFWGSFKCTDSESNIVLQHTYEYRHPSATSIAQKAAAAKSSDSTIPSSPPNGTNNNNNITASTFKVDMISRYLGLVVVPGQHIVKIEVEEFASQMKKAGSPDRVSSQMTAMTAI